MITIISYNESYDKAVRQINAWKLKELKCHGDVLKESRCLAVTYDQKMSRMEVIGFGYLICDENFWLSPEKVKSDCYLALEYQAKAADPACEVEASELLLCSLMNTFDELCEQMPGKRLVLRTWCGADKPDYMEFLLSFGFVNARSMLVYMKDLLRDEDLSADIPEQGKTGDDRLGKCEDPFDFGKQRLIFKENKLETPDEQEAYLMARGRAFETQESHADLKYRLDDPHTRIFTAECEGRIIAGITTWRAGSAAVPKKAPGSARSVRSIASEEGIFCVPEFQRRGIGMALVQFAHAALLHDGISQVILTVYSDNPSAIRFYEKLGYRMRTLQAELHYQADEECEEEIIQQHDELKGEQENE